MSYLKATEELYTQAAHTPDQGLCCTSTPVWKLPGLNIPSRMLEMNYGCGTTVHPRDLANTEKVLYLGVGGGMELLQFSYFNRRKGGVIGVDILDDMLTACANNLEEARKQNEWFDPQMVELRKGSALDIPLADSTVDVVAQNCLFNIFKETDLERALSEAFRVLKPQGRLVLSDPICDAGMPAHLQEDDRLRAQCLSGAIPLEAYLNKLAGLGFGTMEIRARRPYRILHPERYDVHERIMIESVEVCAIKDPMPADGPCVFNGRNAIYLGAEAHFSDGKGHILPYNQPVAVCEKTAGALAALGREDLVITAPSWHYDGGGCC